MHREGIAALALVAAFSAAAPARAEEGFRVFTCPMHADVRQPAPGRCPRCGMALTEAGDAMVEYPVRVESTPPAPRAGEPARLELTIADPRTGRTVTDLETVHEKRLHLFVVSEDLSALQHLHPEQQPDGSFTVELKLPTPGRYQLIADFAPRGGMQQLVQRALLTAGWRAPLAVAHLNAAAPARVTLDGLTVELLPARAVAGEPLELTFLVAGAPLERWLGEWAHLLAVSEDLADVVHAHPDRAGDRLRFEVRFPRPGRHRVWVQLQSRGRVITAPFVVAVEAKGQRFLAP